MNINKAYIILIISALFTFIYILCLQTANAQLIDTDQPPPHVKWKQIESQNFRVIYPEEMEQEAQRMTNTLEFVLGKVQHSLRQPTHKIAVLLQNRGVQSNGFVQLAPRKSVFFTTPPQHMDHQDWLNSLAIHELRHVVQMDKMSGHLRAPFFEQLGLALFGVPLPPWFYEGDAVATETLLTNAGRGRLPSWEMPLRTNLLNGRRYSYQKDYFGSFNDITPGYYEMGFFMTTRLRRQYPFAHDSLITQVARSPLLPYRFSKTLKNITGHPTRGWHGETMGELRTYWRDQLIRNKPVDYPIFPERPAYRTEDFLLPQPLPGGDVLAIRRNPASIPYIVHISPDNNVRELLPTGLQTYPHIAYGGGKIVWDELRYNSRFYKETFSVINLYDLHTGIYRQLTRRTRLFSPTISSTGAMIAAIEIDLSNRMAIVLMDTKGIISHRFPAPAGVNLQTPSFHPSGKKIVMTGLSQDGAALLELDIDQGTYTFLLEKQQQQLERPVYTGGNIIFKAHYDGIDNLYRLRPATGTMEAVTRVPFGAFNPSYLAETDELLFNNYRVSGYGISRIQLEKTALLSVTDTAGSAGYYEPLLKQEQSPVDFTEVPQITHHSRRYHELPNLINFHSLSINNGDFSSLRDVKPGIQWLSDNLLNTASVRLGYEYDPDISSSAWSAAITYQRFYPKISLSWVNRGQLSNQKVSVHSDEIRTLRWRENHMELRTEVPLRFTRLDHLIHTGIYAGTTYTKRYGLEGVPPGTSYVDEIRFPMVYQFYLNHNLLRSARDLAPRWGQNLSLVFRSAPYHRNMSGNLFALRTTFYFPGFVRNHSLQARFGYQYRTGLFTGSNDISLVSGYDELKRTRPFNTLLLSYHLPLAYPDMEIGNAAYIKRLRGSFFTDFENVNRQHRFSPRTLGVELRADMNILRFLLPDFDIGVKLIHVNEQAPKRWLLQYGISYTY